VVAFKIKIIRMKELKGCLQVT